MKLFHTAALAAITILIAGCAGQSPPRETVAPSQKTAGGFGCTISEQNTQQICLTAAGEKQENPSIAQGSLTRTRRSSYTVKMPTGEVAADAFCEIDIVHHSIVYAVLEKGPTSKEAADYLRSQGLCSDE
jgi:hypothetical protein